MEKLTHVLGVGEHGCSWGQAHEPPDARSALVASKSSGVCGNLAKPWQPPATQMARGEAMCTPKSSGLQPLTAAPGANWEWATMGL